VKSAKNFLMIAGAFALAMILFAIAAPKAAHALVSTLVQITNTSANPVPTIESGPRFQAALCTFTGPVATASNFCVAGRDSFTVPTVTSTGAAVKRLIVENVSGFCSNFDNTSLFIKAVRLVGPFVPDAVPNGNTLFTHYTPIVGPAYSYVNDPAAGAPFAGMAETDYTFGQAEHFAFNGGDTVRSDVYYFWTGAGNVDYFCFQRIEGYLVTQ